MTEEREEKMKKLRMRVNQLHERAESIIDSLEEMNLDTEELDKEIREKINACFAH